MNSESLSRVACECRVCQEGEQAGNPCSADAFIAGRNFCRACAWCYEMMDSMDIEEAERGSRT